jgi:hypothetical protein
MEPKPKPIEQPKTNTQRHGENLQILDGQFYHGVYYKDGVGQTEHSKHPKQEEPKTPPVRR